MDYWRHDDGDEAVLGIRGEFDARTASTLGQVLEKLGGDQPRRVIVDLSGLRMIDSLGVGALVALFKRVRAGGGHVSFVGVGHQPLAIFKLLRLDVAFALQDGILQPRFVPSP